MSTQTPPEWTQDPEFVRFRDDRLREERELVAKVKQRTFELQRNYYANTGVHPGYGEHQLFLLLHRDTWLSLLRDPEQQYHYQLAGYSEEGHGKPPRRHFMGLIVIETLDMERDEVHLVLGPEHMLLRKREVQP